MRSSLIALLVLMAPWSAARGDDGPPPKAFLAKHCAECHQGPAPKGDFPLDSLGANFDDEATRDAWELAIGRVRAGEMPPAKRPRPAPEEASAFVAWAQGRIVAKVREQADREGRAAPRRLSRFEYGHAVRDLLSIDLDLAETLPEDGLSQGLDVIGDALALSPVLFERYLQAAQLALDAAIVKGPRPVSKVKRAHYKTAQFMREKFEGGQFVKEVDDAAVFYHDGYTPYDLREFWGSEPGRYKVRISAYGHNSGGNPVLMRAYVGNFIPNAGRSHLAGVFEAPADRPTVFEFEDRFVTHNDSVKPVPYDCGNPWFNDGTIAKYKTQGLAVQWVEVEGPLTDQWPPKGHVALFGDVPLDKGGPDDVAPLLRSFLPKAFRRPVSDEEVERYAKSARDHMAAKRTFEEAMRLGYLTALCSPHFLTLRANPGRLDDHALAARLSFFLWSSGPDEELARLASSKALNRPDVLKGQVDRMLADAKAERFVEHFTDHWLSLRNIDATSPDESLYPEWDEVLRDALLREPRLYFAAMLREDRPVVELVKSDWSMLNERLARHYGIDEVEGQTFRKVTLPPGSHRGGVLTMGAVLKVTANGTNTSPVVRGAWALDRIMGTPPPPPPANVPAVEPDTRGAATIRQQLAKHRNDPGCASCHARIDPPGFALEGFDVIGGRRDRLRVPGQPSRGDQPLIVRANRQDHRIALGPKVEEDGEAPEGEGFANVDEYKDLLAKRPDVLARALAERLMAYATGRTAGPLEASELDAIVARTRAKNHGLRSVLDEIVQGDSFRSQ